MNTVKELLSNKKVLAALAALLVVVLLIGVFNSVAAPKKAMKNYLTYMQKEKGEKLYKTLPANLRKYLKEEDVDEDCIEYLEDAAESFADYYDDCKFKILDISKMAEDDLEEYEDVFEDLADEIDRRLKVQAGRYAIVKITDEDGYVSVRTYDLLKVNGKWFVVNVLNAY